MKTLKLTALTGIVTALLLAPLVAQKKKAGDKSDKPKPKPTVKKDADGIPEGTPEELIRFMQKTARELSNDPTASEKKFKQGLRTILKASEKILKANPKEVRIRREAIGAKIGMLKALGRYGDKTAEKTLIKFLEGLKTDKNKEIRELASQELLLRRSAKIPTLNNKQRAALSADAIKFINSGKLEDRFGVGMAIAQAFERYGNKDDAASLYTKLAGILKKSKDKDISSQAAMLEGFARRVMLPGSRLKVLTGKTVAGEPFDWKKYRGKVVLIDFWATWCGPCRAELPNLLRNYEKYNKQGFEVVAVSLDSKRENLVEFIKAAKIPWVNLFHEGSDGRQPMADYYGVEGIPFTILVDRKGKVVATNVRGARLGRMLSKMIKLEEKKEDAPKPKK